MTRLDNLSDEQLLAEIARLEGRIGEVEREGDASVHAIDEQHAPELRRLENEIANATNELAALKAKLQPRRFAIIRFARNTCDSWQRGKA